MRPSYRSGRRGSAPQNFGMRMGSLIALLVIVGLLYSRASRPETWKWLVNDDADSSQVVNSQVPSNRAQPTATSAKPTATSSNENAGPLAADSSPGMKEARKQAALASTSTAARPSTTATGTAAPPVEAVPQTASTTTAAATTAATSTAGSGAKTAAKPPEPVDTLVPGPTDLSPEEQAMAEEEFSLVTDRKELSLNEMAPYWRLFRWTWAQSFADLEKRAQPQRGVLFKQLYETPEKYRGKPIILQLHVKQIVKWDAPENRGNFKFIYEIWGATDQSVSYPYVVVVSELPPNMKIGANLRYEGTFVGYFLKNMAYRAHDLSRAAPLLIGRIHWKKDTSVAAREAADNHVLWQWLAGVGLAVAIGVWLWLRFARIGSPPTVVPAAAEADMEAWFGHSPTTPLSPPADFSSPPTEPLADTLPVAAAPPSALPPTTTETRTP